MLQSPIPAKTAIQDMFNTLTKKRNAFQKPHVLIFNIMSILKIFAKLVILTMLKIPKMRQVACKNLPV